MVMSKIKISSLIPFFKRKQNIIILFIILLIVLSSVTVFLFLNDAEERIVMGTIYIDSLPAPAGVGVKIVFPDGDAHDPSGTDEIGQYRIDVTNFSGETGSFFISFNGTTYIPKNESGEYFDYIVSNGSYVISIDLFITIPNEEVDDTTSDDPSDTDSSDDTTDDTTDDTSDDGDDSNTDDGTDDGTSDDTTGDDNTSEDDSDDDNSDDDEPISSLSLNTYVWDDETATWADEIGTENGDIVSYKILVEYTGNDHVTDIIISDQASIGLDFIGDATVNGSIQNPDVNSTTHTIQWNLSNITMNDSLIILFNCKVNGEGSLFSDVKVNATENTTKTFNLTKSVTVNIYGAITLEKQVWDIKTLNWVKECSRDIGNTARFKISILYEGSFTVDNVVVTDLLSDGLNYIGNATVNGTIFYPIVNTTDHTLQWDLGDLISQELVIIEYDTNVTINATFINNVKLIGEETIGKLFNETDSAVVTGEAPKHLTCVKQVKHNDGNWVKMVDANVGGNTTFKITLFNNGNRSFYNLNIFDELPNSLSYVTGSSMVIYNNQTFYEEPTVDASRTQLLWYNINSVTHDYLNPAENLSIVFNTTITDAGFIINHVNVTSTICNECDPLDVSDTAFVNATMPIQELTVDAGGQYNKKPGDSFNLTARASGGIPPYNYVWDLNNDGFFDDGNKSYIGVQFDTEGNYTVNVKVIDCENTTAMDTAYITIAMPPLTVDAGGPYTQFAGNVIMFNGSATGGIIGYSWFWDFGDGNTSTQQNPMHTYMATGIYTAILTVTDFMNNSQNDTALITINERDATPPVIDVDDPISALYINGRAVFPFFVPLIFGEIEINITAVDEETSVEKIELHINEELIGTWNDSSIQWIWSERTFGRFRFYIVAYDEAGNWNDMEFIVWKFF